MNTVQSMGIDAVIPVIVIDDLDGDVLHPGWRGTAAPSLSERVLRGFEAVDLR